jgi:transposase-like protein
MSVLSKPYFHDETAAFEHVEGVLWPEGPVCHHCGAVGKHYRLTGVRTKPSKKNPEGVERHGLYKCSTCRGQFTVRMGTVFEESHIPLYKWLQAIHLMCSSKKGISAHQMHRTLEVTYKTAWFLCHRIREAMKPGGALEPMGGAGKVVEADETFIGVREGAKKKRGGYGHKFRVLSLIERGGQSRSVRLYKVSKAEIEAFMNANLHPETRLMTDTAVHYKKKGYPVASHEMVNHHTGEYVRGDVSTNTAEGFFALFKRGMKGVYQHCGEQHLHRYLAEFDFRYSNRMAMGVNDQGRANSALKGVTGKRLTYRRFDGIA